MTEREIKEYIAFINSYMTTNHTDYEHFQVIKNKLINMLEELHVQQ